MTEKTCPRTCDVVIKISLGKVRELFKIMLTWRLGLIGTLEAQDLVRSATWKLTENNVDCITLLNLKKKNSHFCIRIFKVL